MHGKAASRTFALYSRDEGTAAAGKSEYEKPYQRPLADPLTLLAAILLVMNYTCWLSAAWAAVGFAADSTGGHRRYDDGPGRAILGGILVPPAYPDGRGQKRHGRCSVQRQPRGAFVVSFRPACWKACARRADLQCLRRPCRKKEKLLLRHWCHLHPVLGTLCSSWASLVLFFYNCDYVQNLAQTLGATQRFLVHRAAGGVQAVISVICGVVASAVTCRCEYLKLN